MKLIEIKSPYVIAEACGGMYCASYFFSLELWMALEKYTTHSNIAVPPKIVPCTGRLAKMKYADKEITATKSKKPKIRASILNLCVRFKSISFKFKISLLCDMRAFCSISVRCIIHGMILGSTDFNLSNSDAAGNKLSSMATFCSRTTSPLLVWDSLFC